MREAESLVPQYPLHLPLESIRGHSFHEKLFWVHHSRQWNEFSVTEGGTKAVQHRS